jgi:ABC-2 type transport system ATP-binding protein
MTTLTEPISADETKTTDVAIRVQGLSHQYPPLKQSRRSRKHHGDLPAPRTLALDGISFEVKAGEIFGILGPNGGGKTTLFRILSTMLRPSVAGGQPAGSASVMGHDAIANPDRVRRQLGVVFQSPSLDGKLTAVENLRHQGRLYGLDSFELSRRADHWLGYFGLSDRQNEFVERFSGGMRRRLEVAKALLHEPTLLLMDEPATGLDPAARRDLWQKLTQLREQKGMTIALTTHLMDEADRCDRLAIISESKLVAVDTPENLKARIGGDVITVEPEGVQDTNAADVLAAQITEKFGPWDDGASPTVVDGRVRFEKPDGPRIIADVAAAFPGKIRSLTVGRPTIEDVFLHLTGATLHGEGDGS